jgi:hypothetical protein
MKREPHASLEKPSGKLPRSSKCINITNDQPLK